VSSDTIRDVRQRAEDAAYTAVGVGVLGFQQAQVHRRAVQERLAEAARDARGQATTLGGEAWSAVEALSTEVRERVEPVVSRLGERVDPVVADVRSRVEPVLATVGSTVRRVAGHDTPDAPSDTNSTN
jgi:hypothetical protein